MDELEFTKMHALGNDFIVVYDPENQHTEEMICRLAQAYCQRRFGIGADDVLFVTPGKESDVEMRIFEPDGSEAHMCGNGIRCVAHMLNQHGYKFPLTISTLAGERTIVKEGENYQVNMDEPDFRRCAFLATESEETFFEELVKINENKFEVSGVNVGEPHLVIFVEDVDRVEVPEVGHRVRFSDFVQEEGVNVNFVEVVDQGTIRVRTYERGVEDETPACGTGATASAVLSHRLQEINNHITVEMPGGAVEISYRNGERAVLSGPAESVFTGRIKISKLSKNSVL